MYQRIAAIVPKGFGDKITKSLNYLGITIDEKKFLGFLLAFGFAISIGIAVNLWLLFDLHFLFGFFGTFVLFVGGIYMWLNMAAEAKGQKVEIMLPDALQLIASNIKSGLTTERALFVSARPEFGPLEKELKHASREILAGEGMERALINMSSRVKSVVFERTLWLIAKGIQSGGQIADLLTQLSDDLREQRAIQDEGKAEMSLYILLILVSAAFGAPVLFGVSSFITQILTTQLQDLPTIDPEMIQQAGGRVSQITSFIPSGEREILITPDFVVFFSIVAMFFTAVFAAMTIGVINSGKEKAGIKFFPIILVISLLLFYVIRLVLTEVFGTLL
ncbi:type II secretion system F family protein [Candidatus Micrarchaeota archaeon]|nr:type II secretion system F family protein [Candidatus Micrarchaeota archaeon]MBU1930234.1 type II secretion system F family protein [Candidatus Micrarchaeota archaeon]